MRNKYFWRDKYCDNSNSDFVKSIGRWNGVSRDACIAGNTIFFWNSRFWFVFGYDLNEFWVLDWLVSEIELNVRRDAVCGVHSAHRNCWSVGFELNWLLQFPFSGEEEEEASFCYLQRHSRARRGLSVLVFFVFLISFWAVFVHFAEEMAVWSSWFVCGS